MRRLLIVATVLAATAALGGWAVASTVATSPLSNLVQFGHVKSITAPGGAYELKLDPAYFLVGLTAQRAAAQDGREVDNDYYIVDPEHRLLTYRLPAGASATVVTNSSSGIKSTKVPIAELALIVKGKNPKGRPLLESGGRRTLGYWVRTKIDTVVSIEQQYQP